jgi:predicted nuclease with TOPRIM domain
MTIDYDAENWLGNPTREEVLEQHAKLVEAECNCMRLEFGRFRKNQATLVDMLTTTIGERDRLRKELGSATRQLAALREQVESGEWLKGLTSADRQNYQLTEQNRHLQDKVLRLSTTASELPPF